MAYISSAPRQALEAAIDEIIRRITLAAEPEIPSDIREYSLAAAVFLAHAEVENYFTDVLDRLARLYSRSSGNCDELPTRLRAFLFLRNSKLQVAFAKHVVSGDESALLDEAERAMTGAPRNFFGTGLPIIPISGRDIYGDHSYPSEKNIVKVLKRLGIGDPQGAINGAATADVMSLLESLADVRVSLAHSGTLPGMPAGDLIGRVKGAKAFVGGFDLALYRNTLTTHRDSHWRAEMR